MSDELSKIPQMSNILDEKENIPADKFKSVPDTPKSEIPKGRGRPKKIDLQKQKQAEVEISKTLARAAIPQALKALEGLALTRIRDKHLKTKLVLSKDEMTNFTDAFIVLADKRKWFDLSDTPEVAFVLVCTSIITTRIDILREYAKDKKPTKPTKTNEPAADKS